MSTLSTLIRCKKRDEEYLIIDTYKKYRGKSIDDFYLAFADIHKAVLTGQMHCRNFNNFASIEYHDGQIVIEIFWINKISGKIVGETEEVRLSWERLKNWWEKAEVGSYKGFISQEQPFYRPEIIFSEGALKILREQILPIPVLRKKFSRIIAKRWGALYYKVDKLFIFPETIKYSFGFSEVRNVEGKDTMCCYGGIILHNSNNNLGKASYSIHT